MKNLRPIREIAGAVAQSVERVTLVKRSWVRFPLWLPAPYWLGRCQYNVTGWNRIHGLPALSRVWQLVTLSDFSLGARPRYSLAADEDVMKPNKQTNLPRDRYTKRYSSLIAPGHYVIFFLFLSGLFSYVSFSCLLCTDVTGHLCLSLGSSYKNQHNISTQEFK